MSEKLDNQNPNQAPKPSTTATPEIQAVLPEELLRRAVEAKLVELGPEKRGAAATKPGFLGVDRPQPQPLPKGVRASVAARSRRLAAERARRDYEALKLYEPHGDQEKFHACLAPQVVLRGGTRSGKSTAAFVEFARAVTNQDPYGKYPKSGKAVLIGWDEKHCREVFHPRLFRSGPENKMIRDEKTGRWRAYRRWQDADRADEAKNTPPLIPPRLIESISWLKKSERIFSTVRLTTGWEISFYSSQGKPPMGFASDLTLIDEDLAEEEQWIPEMEARLADRGGRLLWSARPKGKNRALYEMSRRAWKLAGEANPDVVEFVMAFHDNPHINADEKRRLVTGWASQGERILEMFDRGGYAMNEWKVFPEFSMGVHGVPSDAKELATGSLPQHWCRYAVIDPGFATCAVLFAAIPPPDFGDYMYLEDEIYLKNCTDKMFAEAMRAKTQGKSYRAFIIDNHGSARSESNGMTVRRQYSNALRAVGVRSERTGFDFWIGDDDIDGRVAAVHGWLATRVSGAGPKLRVLPGRLPNFLMEMEGYMRKRSGKIVLERPETRGDNHLMDCLQYLAACRQVYYVRPEDAPAMPSPVLEYLKQKRRRMRQGRRDFVHLGAGK